MSNQKQSYEMSGTILFSHLREPNNKGEYANDKYEVVLGIDKAAKKQLESLGVQVKNRDAKLQSEGKKLLGDYITLRSKNKPTVLGPDGNLLTDIPLFGTGTEATVRFGLYDNRESNIRAGKGGAKLPGLFNVRITKLVEFEGTKPIVIGKAQ
jgi:hypothetical protein